MGMRSGGRKPRKPIWRLATLAGLALALLGGFGCGDSGDGSGSSGTDLGSCDPGDIKLTDPSGTNGDEHGLSVDISGDWIVVGSPLDDTEDGFEAGSVRVYRCQAAAPISTQQLLAPDAEPGDHFGSSVAIDGDLMVAGASWEDGPVQTLPGNVADFGTNAGAAYVFRLVGGSWEFEQKLVAESAGGPDTRMDDLFGASVSIDASTASGPVIVVGAPGGTRTILRPDLESRNGAAYVYRSGTPGSWSAQQKLDDTRVGNNDQFGHAVAIDGDRLVVGAHADDSPSGEGAAYVFDFDGSSWGAPNAVRARLRASDAQPFDEFGWSVAIDEGAAGGPLIVVGAIGDDDDNGTPTTPLDDIVDMGSAYAFRLVASTWVEQAPKFIPSDGATGDQFGYAVGIDQSDPAGPSILVGARVNDERANDSGAAYFFPFAGIGWAPGVKITASDGRTCDNFGFSVALDAGRRVVGAPFQTDIVFCEAGNSPGAAYLHIP